MKIDLVYKLHQNILFKKDGVKIILLDLEDYDRSFVLDGLCMNLFLEIDGVRTFREIVDHVAREKKISDAIKERFHKDSEDFLESILNRGWIINNS